MACSHVWSFAWRKEGWTARCARGLAVVVEKGPDARYVRRWTHGDRPARPEQAGPAIASLYDQRLRWLREQATDRRQS